MISGSRSKGTRQVRTRRDQLEISSGLQLKQGTFGKVPCRAPFPSLLAYVCPVGSNTSNTGMGLEEKKWSWGGAESQNWEGNSEQGHWFKSICFRGGRPIQEKCKPQAALLLRDNSQNFFSLLT